MDQQLKTRLIGATIIVSLVVIFVPMLFEDSSEHEGGDISSAAAPEFPQEFESQALPLPSSTPKAAATVSAADELAPLPVPPTPTRDEPLDPLDVPVAAGGQADEMGGLETPVPPVNHTPPSRHAVKPVAEAPPSAAAPTKSTAEALPPPVAAKAAPAKPVVTESKPVEQAKAAPAKPAVAESAKAAAAKAPPPVAAAKPKAAPAKPTATEPTKPESAKKDAPGKLSAWVVQAGSFSDEANAKALMFKLRQAKISAFVEMVPGSNGASYRVRVGPELERSRADAILKKMDSEAGVKGMIVSYP